jgi:hypothetical protein
MVQAYAHEHTQGKGNKSMSELTIQTNGHWYELKPLTELPRKATREFDYVRDEEEHYTPRFFRYRGAWYDSHEFVRIVPRARQVDFEHGVSEGSPLLQWGGIQTDSFFSGVVIRYEKDGGDYGDWDRVQVGLALS